jgi:hypothetical protein
MMLNQQLAHINVIELGLRIGAILTKQVAGRQIRRSGLGDP